MATGTTSVVNVLNAGTYTGGTYLIGGTLNVEQYRPGTGTITFAGGALVAYCKITINNSISIPNTTAVLGGNG